MIRSPSVVRHQHSQRGQSHHLYFQCQLGNPDTVLYRGQKLPPTVLTLFRKKKKKHVLANKHGEQNPVTGYGRMKENTQEVWKTEGLQGKS